VPPPDRDHREPASARTEVATSEQAARPSVPRVTVRLRFMIRSPPGLDAISGAGEETGLATLPGFI
jgi:hypothetical protein